MKDRLAARIAELKRERDAHNIAYNAIIAELERLSTELSEDSTTEPQTVAGTENGPQTETGSLGGLREPPRA